MMRWIQRLINYFLGNPVTLKSGRTVVNKTVNSTAARAMKTYLKILETPKGKNWYRSLTPTEQTTLKKQIADQQITPQQLQLKISTKTLMRQIRSRASSPSGYTFLHPFAIPLELLLPKISPKYMFAKNRYDAWYIYNKLPQKYNSMIKIGTSADGLPVYSIKNFMIDGNDLKKIINNQKQTRIGTDFNFAGIHGDGWADKGIDARGKYIVLYDKWDLQPFQRVVLSLGKRLKIPDTQLKKIADWEVSKTFGGQPFWTKNKIYYDDAGNFYRADGKTMLHQQIQTPYIESIKAWSTQPLSNEKVWAQAVKDFDRIFNMGTLPKGVIIELGLIMLLLTKLTAADSRKSEKTKTAALKLLKYGKDHGMSLKQVDKYFSDPKNKPELTKLVGYKIP